MAPTRALFVLSLSIAAPSAALERDIALTQYIHDVWQTGDGLPQNTVTDIAQTPDGYLWLGTLEGLVRFDGVRFTVFDRGTTPELGHDVVRDLLVDREGALWITTSGAGSALYQDRGSLWMGTNAGGLNRLREGRIIPFTTREGLSHDFGRTVLETSDGTLWLGTEGGGVNRLDATGFTAFTTKNGLSNNVVFSMIEDRNGALWVGTGGGISRFRNGRWDVPSAETGITNEMVHALLESRDGSLWIGTHERGAVHVDGDHVVSYTTAEGLGNDFVSVILEDRDGAIWIGTRGGGLTRLVDGRLETFTTEDGLSDNLVGALHEDRDGSLWVGTYGGGLTRIRNGQFARVTERQGLFDNVIHRILEDGRGDVWLSSNRGLFRVSKRELMAVADGTRDRLTPTVYGVADGMRDVEANAGPQAGAVAGDGAVWFPTLGGFVRIDPGDLKREPAVPARPRGERAHRRP